MVEHLPSVHKVLGFLLSPNPHSLFLLTTGSMESDCVRGWTHPRLSRHCGMEGVYGQHSPTGRAMVSPRKHTGIGLDPYWDPPLHPSLALFPLPQLT